MQIITTSNADIQINAPDGQTFMYPSGAEGFLSLTDLPAGKYKVNISRKDSSPVSREIELNGNMMVNMPLETGQSGEVAKGTDTPLFFESPSNDSSPGTSEVKPISGISNDLLVVTTDRDIVDPNDNWNSLREAVNYANRLSNDATITFARNFNIQLSYELPISHNIVIDGEKNTVTIVGSEKAPIFNFRSGQLTLKNLSLVSDCYSNELGGILDASKATSGSVNLVSVKDGGEAERLWSISGDIYLTIDGNSDLHGLCASQGASVMIRSGTKLANAEFSGGASGRKEGVFCVYGSLKNAIVENSTVQVFVFEGGTCEALTARNGGVIEHRVGTINGLRIGPGGIYRFQNNALLVGIVSIAGSVMPDMTMDTRSVRQIVSKLTDIEFDLTESDKSADPAGYFIAATSSSMARSTQPPRTDSSTTPLVSNMKAFLGAQSYTIHVRENQAAGMYFLAGGSADFDIPVSLLVGEKRASRKLSIGQSFSRNRSSYILRHERESNMLTLSIYDTQLK